MIWYAAIVVLFAPMVIVCLFMAWWALECWRLNRRLPAGRWHIVRRGDGFQVRHSPSGSSLPTHQKLSNATEQCDMLNRTRPKRKRL